MRTRLFCEAELAYADMSSDPARPLAARFAAKEAVLKSLASGLGAMRFTDIEVVRHHDGHPELVLHRDAFNFAAGKGVNRFLVTLTHTDTLAQAVVVALA